MLSILRRTGAVGAAMAALALWSAPALGALHLYQVREIFSSADGSVQFIRLHCPAGPPGFPNNGQNFFSFGSISVTNIGGTETRTLNFPNDLPPGPTDNTHVLIATPNFASLPGGITPDFIMPPNFRLFVNGGTLNFVGHITPYGQLPSDGQMSLTNGGTPQINTPRNFAGASGEVNVPPGTCCIGAACTITVEVSCTGTWSQGGACNPGPCAPATAACCAAAGTCTVTNVGSCSGTQQAPGSLCGPNPCPQPNIACCWASGACTTSTAQVCTTGGGAPMASPSACLPNPCPQPSGACCAGATCRVSTAANCTGPNTVFNGAPGCNAPGNSLTPCCLANYDRVAGIAVGDIFAFLGDWFAGSLRADFVGNGTAAPQVASIFGFLTAWFAGGC